MIKIMSVFRRIIISVALVVTSHQSLALGRSNVGVDAGMNAGGFTLGADYEYLLKRSYGFGGFARFFQKDEAKSKNGLFIMGANARLHQYVDEFNFSVAPGFAIINVDGGTQDTTSFGPSFSLAVTYSIAPTVAIGLENSRYWIWFDDDFRGLQIDDTSLRITFNF